MASRPHLLAVTDAPQVPHNPPSLLARIAIHNRVVHRVRQHLQEEGYVEIPVPELTPATGSCEVVDSMFSMDYFGTLAFPRQTGQLYLEEVVARGVDAVYCEGESLRKERKVDARHLTEFKLIEIEKKDMSLEELCDFQEALLKDVVSVLTADEIGERNVERLAPLVDSDHPRITYREALVILNQRGFAIGFGCDLGHREEAALVDYAGDLPVHITHFPEELKFFNMKIDRADPTVVECVDYILPLSGETFGGSLREPDVDILRRRLHTGTMYGHLMNRAAEFARLRRLAHCEDSEEQTLEELTIRYQRGIEAAFEGYLTLFAEVPTERAGFGLGVARLLQFVMDQESIKDAVVFPMDRTRFGGLSQTITVAT
ncbi:MAG: amino acid--tRNA ligase-related protein [Candidatus Eisenbacteria bacterium]